MTATSHTTSEAMDAETLEALRGSIAKWEGIVAGTRENRGVEDCPLCHVFFRQHCEGCPVRRKTGLSHCNESPFVAYANYMCDVCSHVEILDTDKRRTLAAAEMDFLKALLPRDVLTDEPVSETTGKQA